MYMVVRLKILARLFISLTVCLCLLSKPIAVEPFKASTNVANALLALQPKLAHNQAVKLAKAFIEVSSESSCHLPWQILASIAFNESSLDMTKVNHKTKDHGLVQINENTALRYGLSQAKIMEDATYSIRFACKLLRENHKRYAKKHAFWIGIYRSGTALWNERIVRNAKSYDSMIRRTAAHLGYAG